jgi:hypothetical protein
MDNLLNKHRITINYIEAAGLAINFDEIIELGLEQLKAKADKQRNLQRFTEAMSEQQAQPKPISRDVFIRDNVASCATWHQLAELAAQHSIDLSNVKPTTAPAIANHQFYYQDSLVRKATGDVYSITKNGKVVKE